MLCSLISFITHSRLTLYGASLLDNARTHKALHKSLHIATSAPLLDDFIDKLDRLEHCHSFLHVHNRWTAANQATAPHILYVLTVVSPTHLPVILPFVGFNSLVVMDTSNKHVTILLRLSKSIAGVQWAVTTASESSTSLPNLPYIPGTTTTYKCP